MSPPFRPNRYAAMRVCPSYNLGWSWLSMRQKCRNQRRSVRSAQVCGISQLIGDAFVLPHYMITRQVSRRRVSPRADEATDSARPDTGDEASPSSAYVRNGALFG